MRVDCELKADRDMQDGEVDRFADSLVGYRESAPMR